MNQQSTMDTQAAALRDEITNTREELGETVAALATRADIGSRARQSARRTAGRVRTAGTSPELLLVGVAGAVAVLAFVAARRRQR